MPAVRKGETRKDYMSRCIPYVIKREGASSGQAWHICRALWRKGMKAK